MGLQGALEIHNTIWLGTLRVPQQRPNSDVQQRLRVPSSTNMKSASDAHWHRKTPSRRGYLSTKLCVWGDLQASDGCKTCFLNHNNVVSSPFSSKVRDQPQRFFFALCHNQTWQRGADPRCQESRVGTDFWPGLPFHLPGCCLLQLAFGSKFISLMVQNPYFMNHKIVESEETYPR